MAPISRRGFVGGAVGGAVAAAIGARAFAYVPGEADVPGGPRAAQAPSVEVLNPRGRVPLSFIIDDSTCLVNMGHYCMPQFAAAWPNNVIYKRPWRDWPREIPDAFVREFGEWMGQQGVRGKYSLVPYPACVGWLDRDLPGWSRSDLRDSLKLVRELMLPNWDVTPEMVTHTRVIDLKTGRPFDDYSPATMENSWPPRRVSADEVGAYVAYALRILENAEIPCTGITTPGGFGNACKRELSLGVRQALADVYAPEVPFYFKYVADGAESTQPRLEHVEVVGTDAVKFIANVPAGTGDMFGGWDGDRPPEPDKYATEDGTAGRLVELIQRGEPAVMFGHWAGFYSNGTKAGFRAAQRVVSTINRVYGDRTVWLKTSEMARYAAARALTTISRAEGRVTLTVPVACDAFTVRLAKTPGPVMVAGKPLEEVHDARQLTPGTWLRSGDDAVGVFPTAEG